MLDPHAVAQALHASFIHYARQMSIPCGSAWAELKDEERTARVAAARLVVSERLASIDDSLLEPAEPEPEPDSEEDDD